MATKKRKSPEREEGPSRNTSKGPATSKVCHESICQRMNDKTSPQFQEDSSSKKKIHSYCLRYALQVMGSQATTTCDEVEASLKAKDVDESPQRFQRRAGIHTQEIVSRVRKRLRDASIPSKYCKTEDPCVSNMSQVNIQRSSELRLNRGTLHKLRGQKEGLEQAITDAEKERDLWSKKVPGASGKRNHPWDALHLQSDSLDNQGLEATGINNATMQNAADISYRTAPKGTMSDILGKL